MSSPEIYGYYISIGISALLVISEILPFLKNHDYNGIVHYFAVLAEKIRVKRAAEKLAREQAALEQGIQMESIAS